MSASSARRPIGDVLAGQEIHPLPDGWTALEVICLVKCLDEDGEARWCTRGSAGLSETETIGALVSAGDVNRHRYSEGWEDEE